MNTVLIVGLAILGVVTSMGLGLVLSVTGRYIR